ncbi:MAG: hypothetical protein ACODAG_12715 [Myxococcota bacterium]
MPFGETAIVTALNPVPNEDNTTTVPDSLGTTRNGVNVDAQPGGEATTEDDGLAVLGDLETGDLDLVFDSDPALPFTVMADGDVYDLAVGYDGTTATAFPNFPIRYPVGGNVVTFGEDADVAEVDDAVDVDGNTVFFEGPFTGDLTIEGTDVLLFGEGFTGRDILLDGSVEVRGTGVRIRGFTITGDVTVFGDDFGMAFTVVQGTTQINGDAVAFLRNAFCQGATVPSSTASLLDNTGLSPLPDPDPTLCERPDGGP